MAPIYLPAIVIKPPSKALMHRLRAGSTSSAVAPKDPAVRPGHEELPFPTVQPLQFELGSHDWPKAGKPGLRTTRPDKLKSEYSHVQTHGHQSSPNHWLKDLETWRPSSIIPKQHDLSKYAAYKLTMEDLESYRSKLEEPRGSAFEYSVMSDELANTWTTMYSANCSDEKTSCDGLAEMKQQLSQKRAQQTSEKHERQTQLTEKENNDQGKSPSQPEPTVNDVPRRNEVNAAGPRAHHPLSHDNATFSHSYAQYHLSKKLLPGKLELEEDDQKVVKDAWVSMYLLARETWKQNMTCPGCNEGPGDARRHRWSEESKEKYGNIIDDFHRVGNPRSLKKRDFKDFLERLYAAEDDYPRENLELKRCDGLHGLKKAIAGFRATFTDS